MSDSQASLSRSINYDKNNFETAVIIRNPDNARANDQAQHAKSRLKKLIGEIVIEESQNKTEDYKDLLASYDGQDHNTVWVTVGGDGTFSNFANAKPRSPIIINPAGNANDIGHMLSWAYTYGHPERILKWGRVAELRPLEIVAQPPDGSEPFVELAFGYWGAGLSGRVAEKLSSDDHRFRRDHKLSTIGKLLLDGNAIIDSLQAIPSLKLIENDNEQLRYEFQYVNGSRFARVFRVGRGQLLEPKAHRVELDNSKTLGLIAAMGKAAISGGDSQLAENEVHKFKIESDSEFSTQRDGENRPQLSGTTFTIGFSDYSAKVLTSHRNDLFRQILL